MVCGLPRRPWTRRMRTSSTLTPWMTPRSGRSTYSRCSLLAAWSSTRTVSNALSLLHYPPCVQITSTVQGPHGPQQNRERPSFRCMVPLCHDLPVLGHQRTGRAAGSPCRGCTLLTQPTENPRVHPVSMPCVGLKVLCCRALQRTTSSTRTRCSPSAPPSSCRVRPCTPHIHDPALVFGWYALKALRAPSALSRP